MKLLQALKHFNSLRARGDYQPLDKEAFENLEPTLDKEGRWHIMNSGYHVVLEDDKALIQAPDGQVMVYHYEVSRSS